MIEFTEYRPNPTERSRLSADRRRAVGREAGFSAKQEIC
jgi:hypothetical protein